MSLECPIPSDDEERITLAHGDGALKTRRLIAEVFQKAFANPALAADHDGAVLPSPRGRIALTTDSFVVKPLFFPGGDIGRLAVDGTVNDLAMCGARPRYLTAGFILEEGLRLETLRRVVRSMAEAAAASGVQIVTGDTKVLERRGDDGLYVNTAGVGEVEHDVTIAPAQVRPDDAIILSGDPGRHGVAVLSRREGLALDLSIGSDVAPLVAPVLDLLSSGIRPHCLRDLTRGGLATALGEIADHAHLGVVLDEERIPIEPTVATACDLLGLDPLYLASEGRFVAIVSPSEVEPTLRVLRSHPVSAQAAVIGRFDGQVSLGDVVLRTTLGTERVLDLRSALSLPRIC